MEKISRETFIRLAAALGVGAASASVAACGGGSGGSGSSSGGGSGGSGGGSGAAKSTPAASSDASGEASTATGGSAIAQESDVGPGSAVTFKDGGKDAVLVHLDSGEFVAYSAICTHAGCTVAYKNAQLACPCHGSVFDPANGAEVVSGPAQRPLPEIPVEVQDGQVVRA
ncbi:MAG TPA: Rieske (2Fe-2S) protein [Rubrobacter sp.]|nr:Rieske (2Fe-2S) protein [Rubrobacter sp.]